MELSNRFKKAFEFAYQLHRNQFRKGSQTPYIAHLLGVASLVMEDGGDEDEVIAALLHDAPEDQGGLEVLKEIEHRFGRRVAKIVDGCTDTYLMPKPPWRERKENYLQKLSAASWEIRRIALADKLHNARSILNDLRRNGSLVWAKFNGGKNGTLWYYRALVKIFLSRDESPMVAALVETLQKIEELELYDEAD